MVLELQKLLPAIKKRGPPPGEQSNRGLPSYNTPFPNGNFKKTKGFVDTIVSTCYANLAFSRNQPLKSPDV
jgi:hypothetical protein